MKELLYLKDRLTIQEAADYLTAKLDSVVAPSTLVELWHSNELILWLKLPQLFTLFDIFPYDGEEAEHRLRFDNLNGGYKIIPRAFNRSQIDELINSGGTKEYIYLWIDDPVIDKFSGKVDESISPLALNYPSMETFTPKEISCRRNDIDVLINKLNDLSLSFVDTNPLTGELERGEVDELSTSERKSLYKMILGMAIEKYGYDPNGRNKSTGENNGSIFADLAKHGLSVNADTIRNHLKAAAENLK